MKEELIRYEEERGWRGKLKNVEIGGDWGKDLGNMEKY